MWRPYGDKIVGYNKVRNIIIHNYSNLDDNTLSTKVRAFIDGNTYIKEDNNGMIQFEENFCLEVIENINSFFSELFKEINKKYES